MPTEMIDLDELGLSFGGATTLEGEVELRDVEIGGQIYTPDPALAPFRLDLSRPSAGYALRLRFRSRLVGPCFRCLEGARARVDVDAREVDQPSVDGIKGAELDPDESGVLMAELDSPYVEKGVLALGRWATDALILALPNQIICREDCLGLCPGCGESLNDSAPADHEHEQTGDPRWAKLKDLG
jgi:uncharacterized protein